MSLVLIAVALSSPIILSRPVAAYTQHLPIVIHGNSAFTPANGVIGGNGIRSNPYIIEGWQIDSGYSDGILVELTNVYFVIRNVLVQSGKPNIVSGAGIHFINVMNGRIENSTVRNNYQGLLLTSATSADIANSTFFGNGFGVTISNSANVVVSKNAISSSYEDGITSYNATQITIRANSISNQHRGIALASSTRLRISANDIAFSTHQVVACICPGLLLDAVRDVEISNNTIHANNNGILQAYVVNNVTMVDNTIVDNSNYGLSSDAGNLTIRRNTVSRNGGNGISVGSLNGQVLDNRATNNGGAGILVGGAGNRVAGNIISGNGRYGIELFRANSAILRSNMLTENGIYVHGDFYPQPALSDYTSHTIAPDNMVNGLPVYYYKNSRGVTIDGIQVGELIIVNCTRVQVSNLAMNAKDVGVEMAFVGDVMISGNRIAGSRWEGVQMMVAHNVTISGNEVSAHAFTGIEVTSARHVVVLRNRFSGNGLLTGGAGIVVEGTDVSLVSNNFTDNAVGLEASGASITLDGNNLSRNRYGMMVSGNSVLIARNNISSSRVIGLDVSGTGGAVYQNNFVDNGHQAGAINVYRYVFDNGYPSGGNFWSDYTGRDACHGPKQDQCPGPDGIGDTPYALVGQGVDRYPLMNPYGLADWPPGPSFTVSPSSGSTATVFKVDASSSWDREDPISSLEVRWDWEDDGTWDTPWSLGKTAEHQYPTPGIYTIRLEVRDKAGLTRETTEKVKVVARLGISVGASQREGVAPLSVYLYANLTGGLAPFTYRWAFGDGGVDSFPVGTHTYHDPGTYAATLTVVDALGEIATTGMTIIVHETFGLVKPPTISGLEPTLFFIGTGFAVAVAGALALLAIRRKKRR
jgi:parallel beta-helix repeat protein